MHAMQGLMKVAEAVGVFLLLVYAAGKADWGLLALAFILIELMRIRGILTGDEYEAFLNRKQTKETQPYRGPLP